MPELPEVETTARGMSPHLVGQRIESFELREARLRWPVDGELVDSLVGVTVRSVTRRSKLMLIHLDNDQTLISHLGMSGSWRICDPNEALKKHDHLLLTLASGRQARYHDPRRFGSFECTATAKLNEHPRICGLGPEPLTDDFTAQRLFDLSRGRKGPVKAFIMDNAVVVGVGNIYATEALFTAGIAPNRAAGRISLTRYQALTSEIKAVLARAIEQGGSTLRDFTNSEGQPGYFAQTLQVYGRSGEQCVRCKSDLKTAVIGQRTSVWCPSCQR